MWLSPKVVDFFKISQESFTGLREDLAALRAERDALKQQLVTSNLMNDWLRMKVNTLEAERSQLLEKAYNIKVAPPQLVKAPLAVSGQPKLDDFTFEDVGEQLARSMGLPSYTEN